MSGVDLSGRWSGFYSYPAGAEPPVAFDAELSDLAGRVTGMTSETDPYEGVVLEAILDGRRSGRSIEILKMYERADELYDSVRYEGEVSPEGDEIAGRWHVPGAWSGSFVMVRSSAVEEETVREEAVETR